MKTIKQQLAEIKVQLCELNMKYNSLIVQASQEEVTVYKVKKAKIKSHWRRGYWARRLKV